MKKIVITGANGLIGNSLSKFLENKLNLLDIYFCTHLPGVGSTFRKPEAGMFLQASREHDIDLEGYFPNVDDGGRDADDEVFSIIHNELKKLI